MVLIFLILMTCAQTALTVALNAGAVPIPPMSVVQPVVQPVVQQVQHRWVIPDSLMRSTASSIRPPFGMVAIRLSNDSLWSECKTTKVSGVVTDSAHKGIAGVWVRGGFGFGDPTGQRVKTDSTGAFHVIADRFALSQTIEVFRDSSSIDKIFTSIAAYDKNQLQITNCVAAPITIVVTKPRTKEESSITGLWKDCPSLEVSGIVRDLYGGTRRAGVWVQDGWPDFAQRTETDSVGAFHFTVDKTHELIMFFGDSVIRKKPLEFIGMYGKGQLIVNNCVADPINIKVMPW